MTISRVSFTLCKSVLMINFIQRRIVWERLPNSIQNLMLFWKPRPLKVGSLLILKNGADILHIRAVQQNQILESKIQRRPSRTSAAKKPEKLTASVAQPTLAPGSAAYGSTLGSVLSTSLGPSSSHGPQLFLRIHTADAVHISTTIPVYALVFFFAASECSNLFPFV